MIIGEPMPTILIEGELIFQFGDKWRVCKYDDSTFYNRIKGRGIKGVDFLAVSDKSVLLMEVKHITASDEKSSMRLFYDADIEQIERIQDKLQNECRLNRREKNFIKVLSPRPYLADEVSKKVKDTLLGLIAGQRYNDVDLNIYHHYQNKPIVVLLFLERSKHLNEVEHFKPLASHLKITLEQQLSFLGNIHINVVNTLTIPHESAIKVYKNKYE